MLNNSHFINNEWVKGEGNHFVSINPASNETIWEGTSATESEVNRAVLAGKAAFEQWAWLPLEERIQYLEKYCQQLEKRKEELTQSIAKEVGKPLWDARGEVGAMIGKLKISIEAHNERTGTITKMVPQGTSIIRHRPHGILAVFGPYNFPGHLPNGHFIPALLAGNTLVFKPSELTPLVSQIVTECWQAAELPHGVFNLIQGGLKTGQFLAKHQALDGLLFTGSAKTGQILHQQFGGSPEKILALELGGNNPLIVSDISNVDAAAYITIQSAFLTSGQRCTCARRLIVPQGKQGDEFIQRTVEMIEKVLVGAYTETPEPFMGPVISKNAANQLLESQKYLIEKGGQSLTEMKPIKEGSPFLSPGLMDVTSIVNREDREYFGPFLQLIRVKDFEEAIHEANRTVFGLSAGLLSEDQEHYQFFLKRIRAGIVNWNRPLTGASSNAPFGGIGLSGNHFPSAYYAADYCSYPVASLEHEKMELPSQLASGIYL